MEIAVNNALLAFVRDELLPEASRDLLRLVAQEVGVPADAGLTILTMEEAKACNCTEQNARAAGFLLALSTIRPPTQSRTLTVTVSAHAELVPSGP